MWYLNGSVLLINSLLVEIIEVRKLEYEGFYCCEVKNFVGIVIVSVFVIVRG